MNPSSEILYKLTLSDSSHNARTHKEVSTVGNLSTDSYVSSYVSQHGGSLGTGMAIEKQLLSKFPDTYHREVEQVLSQLPNYDSATYRENTVV